jgi:hypothetical protein
MNRARTTSMKKGVDTMPKLSHLLATFLLLGLSAGALHAEPAGNGLTADTDLGILLDAIRANRKAMVAINLQLTDDEAAKFWPVYDRYQKENNAVGDRLVALIGDYTASFGNMSDDKAMKLVGEYLDIQADQVKVRRSYVDQFAKVLPGRKVARFYQIENKMDAVIRYNLASTIPVIEASDAAAK